MRTRTWSLISFRTLGVLFEPKRLLVFINSIYNRHEANRVNQPLGQEKRDTPSHNLQHPALHMQILKGFDIGQPP